MQIRYVILGLILLSTGNLFAQNEDDALRLSQTFFGGTARNLATAGGLTAMGADFSNASQNPAGLGRLSKSNWSISGNLDAPFTNANYAGNETKSGNVTANFSNLSYVKAYELDPNKFKNWYSIQIGLGFNRIKSFNDSISYSGYSDSSIIHSFIREAEGTHPDDIYSWHPFTAGLAYDVYAMDPGANVGEYTTAFQNGQAFQKRRLKRKGGMTEFNVFTLSGNYANKLLVGGSLNAVRTNYSESFAHEETYVDSLNWLNSTKYTGLLNIKGWGINLRAGAIYMPIEQLRIGLAIETPTLHWMNDYWTNNMTSKTDGGDYQVLSEFVPTGSYKYKIRTPFKANLSAAYVNKEFGSIGAEVEFVDYRGALLKDRRFSEAPYSFAAENVQIDNIYKTVLNYKIGVEGRIKKRIYVRGGFAYYGTPYQESSGNAQNPTLFYTAGAGYNFGAIYMDFAYVLQTKKEEYYAYDPTINGSYSQFNSKNSQIVLSIGARF